MSEFQQAFFIGAAIGALIALILAYYIFLAKLEGFKDDSAEAFEQYCKISNKEKSHAHANGIAKGLAQSRMTVLYLIKNLPREEGNQRDLEALKKVADSIGEKMKDAEFKLEVLFNELNPKGKKHHKK